MGSRKQSGRRYAYLDTNILSHWSLYRTATTEQIAAAPKRVKASLSLLKRIKEKYFVDNLVFETSNFSFAELFQVMRDNIIANKMLRDGQSLVYFFNLRQQYALTVGELSDLHGNIDLFYELLESIGIKSYEIALDMTLIEKFVEEYGMATSDAMHVSWAYDCQYFVTCDRDLIRIGKKWSLPRIMRPSTLSTIKVLHHQTPMNTRTKSHSVDSFLTK